MHPYIRFLDYFVGFHLGYLDKILDSILDFFEDIARSCNILARYSRCRTLGRDHSIETSGKKSGYIGDHCICKNNESFETV